MKIFLGILFLFFSCCGLYTTFSTDYDKNLKNKIIVWLSTVCAGVCLGLAFGYFAEYCPKKEYPAREYTLQLKVTTTDEHIDTTYILKRK